MLIYLIVYSVFAYLIIIGQILGELSSGIKPSGWHLAFFLISPLFLPLYIGFWMFHVANDKQQDKIVGATDVQIEKQIKVEIKPFSKP
jgi:amino acid permease